MKTKFVLIVSLFLMIGKSYSNGPSKEESEVLKKNPRNYEKTYKELKRYQEQLQFQIQNIERLHMQKFSETNSFYQGYWPNNNNGFQNPYGINTEQIFTCSSDGSVCTNAQGIKYWREGASELGDRDGGKQDEGTAPELKIKDFMKARAYSF